MNEWWLAAWKESMKQAPSVAIFSLIFVAGFYFQTRYLGEKIDALSHTVTDAFREQRSVIKDAVGVIATNNELIRRNTEVILESATARRQLAESMDRIKDFMLTIHMQGKSSGPG